MILPVRGITSSARSSASEHSFIPYIYVFRASVEKWKNSN